jgi:glycosyltransferase involved in cell wall biosynthesis
MEDVDLAVNAFCALPQSIRDLARFTIIGFGDHWEHFKEYIAETYPGVGNLVLKERIEPSEAPALLARCDIGCLPLAETVFNHCKSPTKMFEYMAMKVAVLGSPMGEVARIIQDGENGMLATDLSGYVNRMSTLILDADKRRAMTERAYATVCDGYHLDAMGDKLVALLKELQAEASTEA